MGCLFGSDDSCERPGCDGSYRVTEERPCQARPSRVIETKVCDLCGDTKTQAHRIRPTAA